MNTVYVMVKEFNKPSGTSESEVHQVYNNEEHCYQACVAFQERYPEYDWSYSKHTVMEPLVLK